MSQYHLAQLNTAVPLYPLDDPRMAGFMDNLDRINRLGEGSEGFVWKLNDADGHSMEFRIPGAPEDMAINLTVWENWKDLSQFAYRSEHVEFFKRRAEWFENPSVAMVVLWWLPHGHSPTLEEAWERLKHLREHGPTPYAFTTAQRFPAPES